MIQRFTPNCINTVWRLYLHELGSYEVKHGALVDLVNCLLLVTEQCQREIQERTRRLLGDGEHQSR